MMVYGRYYPVSDVRRPQTRCQRLLETCQCTSASTKFGQGFAATTPEVRLDDRHPTTNIHLPQTSDLDSFETAFYGW